MPNKDEYNRDCFSPNSVQYITDFELLKIFVKVCTVSIIRVRVLAFCETANKLTQWWRWWWWRYSRVGCSDVTALVVRTQGARRRYSDVGPTKQTSVQGSLDLASWRSVWALGYCSGSVSSTYEVRAARAVQSRIEDPVVSERRQQLQVAASTSRVSVSLPLRHAADSVSLATRFIAGATLASSSHRDSVLWHFYVRSVYSQVFFWPAWATKPERCSNGV